MYVYVSNFLSTEEVVWARFHLLGAHSVVCEVHPEYSVLCIWTTRQVMQYGGQPCMHVHRKTSHLSLDPV
jgi:hypothetical protein